MTMKKGFISPLFFEENFVCIVFLIDRTLLLCHCIFSWPAGFLMKNLILSWGFPCDKFVCLFVSFFLSFCAEGILWHLQKFWQYIKHITLEFTPSIIQFAFCSQSFLWISLAKDPQGASGLHAHHIRFAAPDI
jgi:hypothetical protein